MHGESQRVLLILYRDNANTVSQPNRQVAVFHGRIREYTASYDLRHADQMTITD